MTDDITRAELYVDAVLANPPTDNAEIMAVAVELNAKADAIAALVDTWRAQARRLRDFAVARQARLDATPENATASPATPRE
ncbi:hypothetical protein HLH33_13075 [Gluconacetobacter diazotrophicus]|uniref:Uncharacterized protein n=1 Tax=Gluconacetobacter diazotrophicus TaxID=33996 RepID=A0A7W4I6P2_GLUDI|nr:hypothetical protein [Gluconacetobacter diazotrophicus]MBB2157232.1 hypothetical protein [Gluconacetobacter diazotrophicus]